jgi:uncharacterized protein YjiK
VGGRSFWLASGLVFGLGWAAQVPLVLTERYDLDERSNRARLPNRLDEASGLAVTADGRVFTHGDEHAIVYEVDPWEGRALKRFGLGVPAIPGDFEGIAVAGDRFFLISSQGLLLEFREGAAEESVAFRGVDTGLMSLCEVEGLAFEPATESLVAACKTVPSRDRGFMVLYRISLQTLTLAANPLRVSLADLERVGLRRRFAPSGIEVDPRTGNLILISAQDESILEMTPAGLVVSGFRFDSSDHPQAEGVSLLPDGTLLLADEAQGRRAHLTTYAPRPLPGSDRPGAPGGRGR